MTTAEVLPTLRLANGFRAFITSSGCGGPPLPNEWKVLCEKAKARRTRPTHHHRVVANPRSGVWQFRLECPHALPVLRVRAVVLQGGRGRQAAGGRAQETNPSRYMRATGIRRRVRAMRPFVGTLLLSAPPWYHRRKSRYLPAPFPQTARDG